MCKFKLIGGGDGRSTDQEQKQAHLLNKPDDMDDLDQFYLNDNFWQLLPNILPIINENELCVQCNFGCTWKQLFSLKVNPIYYTVLIDSIIGQ